MSNIHPAVRPPNLSPTQVEILRTLATHPDAHIQLGQWHGWYVSPTANLDRSIYMPSVRRLLALHYITRADSVITLTDAGTERGRSHETPTAPVD